MIKLPSFSIIHELSVDCRLLFLTRAVRLFAYGLISVILVLYLDKLGLSKIQVGWLLTSILLGDTVISLWITTLADRLGRKRMLILGSCLMIFAGVLFAITNNIFLLFFAATVGVISPSGNEVGPFLSIEQAVLSQVTTDQLRTKFFAWYTLSGSLATALGALTSGSLMQISHWLMLDDLIGYRFIVLCYAVIGAVLMILSNRLSKNIEVVSIKKAAKNFLFKHYLGLHSSLGKVLKLSFLFSMDAFAGGFILQSIVAYWFYSRFHAQPIILGSIFWGANILAGLSALTAARLATRIGLINTMVFTHILSNILLMLVPFMPNLSSAILVYLLRCSISQMDVPTRQSYTMAIVYPDERSATSGITNVTRSLGASLSPLCVGPLLGSATLLSVPFFLAGGIKIIYDLLLYKSFRAVRPPEENK